MPRGERASRATRLLGSFRSPNTMAVVGQACEHAVCNVPSAMGRFSALAAVFAALMRWMQKVHFSITPTSRIDTSGLSCRCSGFGHSGLKKLKKRTLYGARVGTVARADAAVVDLRVQPVLVLMARIGRAHRFARRVVALLAEHRPELDPHVREITLVVAFDAEPVHGAAAPGLFGRHRGNVVFGMARRDAGFAARALVEIDRHSPAVRH